MCCNARRKCFRRAAQREQATSNSSHPAPPRTVQARTLTPAMFKGVRQLVSCSAVKVAPKEGDTVDRAKYYQGACACVRMTPGVTTSQGPHPQQHASHPPPGIKFYDPEIVGDTPEAVEKVCGEGGVAALSGSCACTRAPCDTVCTRALTHARIHTTDWHGEHPGQRVHPPWRCGGRAAAAADAGARCALGRTRRRCVFPVSCVYGLKTYRYVTRNRFAPFAPPLTHEFTQHSAVVMGGVSESGLQLVAGAGEGGAPALVFRWALVAAFAQESRQAHWRCERTHSTNTHARKHVQGDCVNRQPRRLCQRALPQLGAGARPRRLRRATPAAEGQRAEVRTGAFR